MGTSFLTRGKPVPSAQVSRSPQCDLSPPVTCHLITPSHPQSHLSSPSVTQNASGVVCHHLTSLSNVHHSKCELMSAPSHHLSTPSIARNVSGVLATTISPSLGPPLLETQIEGVCLSAYLSCRYLYQVHKAIMYIIVYQLYLSHFTPQIFETCHPHP
jgi:hypothetical protein